MVFGMNLGTLVVHLRANTTQFHTAMSAAEVHLKKVGIRMQKTGKMMMLRVTAPMALIGGAAIKHFATFDDAITKSIAIMSDVTPKIRREMEDTARAISGEGITPLKDLAESYFFLASAGLDAKQSIAALPTVEKFAVAGAFNMARATDLLTDAQSALGLTVKDSTQNMISMNRVSDVLVRANTLANASVEQFSKALTNKAAAALKILNKDVEEGVAVLAAFADQGVKDVEAGEKLYIVLRDLQRAAMKQPEVWRKLGMSTYDARGKMRPVADILGQLEDKFSTMSDEQKKATATLLGFQDRSFSAIQTLLGTSHKIREYEKALRKAGGYTKRVADVQLTSFTSAMKKFKNNVGLAAEELGRALAPALLSITRGIQFVTDWFRRLDKSTQKWIASAMVVLAVLGPMIWLIGILVKTISLATAGVIAMKMAYLIWAIGVIVVVVALWALADALTEADLGLISFYKSMKTVHGEDFGSVWERLALQVEGYLHGLGYEWWLIYEDIKYGVFIAADYIAGVFEKMWAKIVYGFQRAKQVLTGGLSWVADKIATAGEFYGIIDKKQLDASSQAMKKWAKDSKKAVDSAFINYQTTVAKIAVTKEQTKREYEDRIQEIVGTWGVGSANANARAKKLGDVENRIFRQQLEAAGLSRPGHELGGRRDSAFDPAKLAAALAKGLESVTGTQDKALAKIVAEQQAALAKIAGEEYDGTSVGGPVGIKKAPSVPAEFQQMSLRRFGLEGPATATPKKQEVHDEKVDGRLAEIIQLLSNKPTVATLG